jgi:hypothetical protein
MPGDLPCDLHAAIASIGAILLGAAVPAASSLAHGLTALQLVRSTGTSDPGLLAIGNAEVLLAAAPHGRGEGRLGAEQGNSNQNGQPYNDFMSREFERRRISRPLHGIVVSIMPLNGNSGTLAAGGAPVRPT